MTVPISTQIEYLCQHDAGPAKRLGCTGLGGCSYIPYLVVSMALEIEYATPEKQHVTV